MENLIMAKMNKVAVNLAQDFTDVENEQARVNIGAGTAAIEYSNGALPPTVSEVNKMTVIGDGRVRFDTHYRGIILPEPGQTDKDKVLVANYAGSPAIGTGVWKDIHEVGIREVPTASSADAGKALVVNNSGTPTWDNVGGGSSITMASFKTTKTINIPAGNSSMLTDTYKLYDLPAKTAVNMTVFVCDMDRHDLAMMGISIWCGSVHIAANSFTRGTYTSISHALPVCYYNNTESPIEIKIGFNGTFVQQAVDIEMMGFTITQGA